MLTPEAHERPELHPHDTPGPDDFVASDPPSYVALDTCRECGYMGPGCCLRHSPPDTCRECGAGRHGRCELPDHMDTCPYGCSPER